MRRRIFALAAIAALILMLVLPAAAAAEDKQYHYGFINVDIAVQPNGDLRVTEVIQYVFTYGEFHHGFRGIDMNRTEAITDVQVSEGAVAYRHVNGETIGGYTVARSGQTTNVDWWFPYTSNAARTFTLTYTVKGALRIYDGGDQVYWVSIWPERGQRVMNTQSQVRLPAGVTDPAQVKYESYGAKATAVQTDAATVLFTTGVMPDGQSLTVRVQFPHGIVQATAARLAAGG